MGIIENLTKKGKHFIDAQIIESRRKRAVNNVIDKMAREEYDRSRRKESIIYAREKARLETRQKIKRLRDSYKPVNYHNNISSGGFGFGGGLNSMFERPIRKSKNKNRTRYIWD